MTLRLRVFRKGTNFLLIVTYKISTKVIFLTNSILISKNITNKSLSIIISFLENKDIKVVYPIKEGI
jgi:predicted ATP-grasp superfamily ATP-dependent carboligase